jgi:uncharacterized protein YjbJ (UPF0337 family)
MWCTDLWWYELRADAREDQMNDDVFKGQWMQLKGKIREQWGKLTDDDLDQIQGKSEQLIGRLQQRYGWQREQAQREVDAWFDNSGYAHGRA